jgi:hypothetical protein
MDTSSRNELEKLYGLAKSATATTHFYNQVYKYKDCGWNREYAFGHRYGSPQKALLSSSRHVALTTGKTDKIITRKVRGSTFLVMIS